MSEDREASSVATEETENEELESTESEFGKRENEKTDEVSESTATEVTEDDEEHEPDKEESEESAVKAKGATFVHPLEGMNREAVIQTVDDLQKQLRHLSIENTVFETFLKINDPEAFEELEEGIQRKMSPASKKTSVGRITFRDSVVARESIGARESIASRELPATRAVQQESSQQQMLELPKISLMQRTDMVLKEIDEVQANLREKLKNWHDIKFNLVARIEELETRKNELEQSLKNFEDFRQNQEVTFPKFVRFMEEWSKKSRLMVDKMRLRYSSLKVQYHKTSAILAHKKLIGENLQEVDFDQLRIENLHLVEKIEKQNILLLELKKMTGAGNLKLSQQKKLLLQKIEMKEKLGEDIKKKEDEVNISDNEIMKLGKELQDVTFEHDNMKEYMSKYEAPEIIEYIRKKVELEELKRELKMWTRRINVKKLALKVANKQLIKLLGNHNVDPSWLD